MRDPKAKRSPRKPSTSDPSEQGLRMLEHSPLPMAAVEGAGHVVRYVNPAFCRLLDRPEAMLVGRPFCELLPEKDPCVALLERVYLTGKASSHTEQPASEASSVFSSYTLWPLVVDGLTAGVIVQVSESAQFRDKTLAMNEALILGSVRQHELTEAAEAWNAQLQAEISDRKRAQAEARSAGERFHLIAQSMPQKIFTAQPGGAMDYFNPQWTEFTGLSMETLQGSGWTACIHPDDVAESVRAWQASIESGEPFDVEHRVRRADGEYRWHLSRALASKDSDGRPLLWLGSSTDIHEVKEADDRKNEFLAMLAHELRNPLAPLRYMVEVMKRADCDGSLIEPALATMERQVAQMTRLIDDLLDVSRITRGKLQLRPQELELESVLRHVVEAARSALESSQQELTVTLPQHPVYLRADPVRLAQVFGNLLHNACKFARPGGRITLAAELAGTEAVVRVKDSGIGIAPDMLSKIFEMFTQGDQTLERLQGGLGIGLTLVRRLVEMHGGSVEAFSEGVGRGSEFVVRLPALAAKAKSVAPVPSVNEPAQLSARRILVVDDNHDAAQALSMLLRLTGNETQLAFDGMEAVDAAAKFLPDVVLLDIGMPKLNGYDAARRIRAQPWGKAMVLVAITGWGQDEDRQKTAAAGFDAHLVKPVEYDVLTKVLASLRGTGTT